MPSTELSYIYVDGFVIVVIVIFDLDATTTATFRRLENLGYLTSRRRGRNLDSLLCTLRLCSYS